MIAATNIHDSPNLLSRLIKVHAYGTDAMACLTELRQVFVKLYIVPDSPFVTLPSKSSKLLIEFCFWSQNYLWLDLVLDLSLLLRLCRKSPSLSCVMSSRGI